jgi:hypothetical protein
MGSVSLNNCLLFVLLHHGCFHLSKIYLSLTQKSAGELSPEATAYPKTVLTTCTIIISHLIYFVNSFLKFFWNIFCVSFLLALNVTLYYYIAEKEIL